MMPRCWLPLLLPALAAAGGALRAGGGAGGPRWRVALEPAVQLLQRDHHEADPQESQAAILQMIAEEQDQLLARIAAVAAGVNTTRARVERAVVSAQQSLDALTGLQREVADANSTAGANFLNSRVVNQTVPEAVRLLAFEEDGIKTIRELLRKANASLEEARGIQKLREQVDQSAVELSTVQPDIDNLVKRVVQLESRLADGDIQEVISNEVAYQVTGVMEDLGRSWRAVPDPWVE
mmetsp:Transcript_41567/g.129749  ORF Transcript_41567/g.129749 Transcript_41567/m.129749 type:complete len:237 (-) Transcript_41567:107-817(-)